MRTFEDFKFRFWKPNEEVMGFVSLNQIKTMGSGLSIPDELMMSTNQRDKHNKEIYEGDIVCYTVWDWDDRIYNIGIVEWNDEVRGFVINWVDFWSDALDDIKEYIYVDDYNDDVPTLDWSKLEIIGNIYQYPELVKEFGGDER